MRWSLLAVATSAGVVFCIAWWVNTRGPEVVAKSTPWVAPQVREEPPLEIPLVRFTDVTLEAGIDFIHTNGACGDKLLPETMGSGCAFLDYDSDGNQDLLLVNSCHWPSGRPDGADGPLQPTTALYRNDGTGRFDDATPGSGLDVTAYGTGVAVGDCNNDGLVDVFLTAVGPNRLFLNRGGGRFTDVTAEAGIAGGKRQWSTSAGFFDYDRDGDLDLFVCNYVEWSKEIDLSQDFSLTGVGRAYGPPILFRGTFPSLYRNDGEGRFADVSEEAGIQVANPATGVPMAKSLGLAPTDVDRDGWIDVVVANDTVQNFLFHNQGDGTFKEAGAAAGIGFDSAGAARGAMGIDTGHYRNDGDVGVAIGNFANEMTALYVSQGTRLMYTDEAIAAGLGPPTRLDLTFGLFFFDFDLDGRLDLFTANGHLEEEIGKVQTGMAYRQPAKLFWNAGPEQPDEFVRVPPEKCGDDLSTPVVGRGAAFADIDRDGDLDVLVTQVADRPVLLRNEGPRNARYLRFKLVGTRDNRDAVGAWVEVTSAGETLRRQVMPARSYLSQVELPVTVGLGEDRPIDRVRVLWPDGTLQKVNDYVVNGLTSVVQK